MNNTPIEKRLDKLLKPYYVEGQTKPDITSVLKFMYEYEKKGNVLNMEPGEGSSEGGTLFGYYINQIYENYLLINKPIIPFYTKTELTDLENLLTKLKPNKMKNKELEFIVSSFPGAKGCKCGNITVAKICGRCGEKTIGKKRKQFELIN